MICKICHKNETDSTSGICWECSNKIHIVINTGYYFENLRDFYPLRPRLLYEKRNKRIYS